MRRLIVVVALAGCGDELEPPLVLEPADGAVVDRALVRVRASAPDDLYSSGLGSGEFSSAIRGHTNWRVDGGTSNGVQFPTMTRDDVAPFMFATTLDIGDNLLEIGACDSFDECAWTGRHVTVEPRSGSPDPAFARTGQLIVADETRGVYPTPLADGRVLLGTENVTVGSVLIMLRADGTRDPAFGDDGVAILPGYGGRFRVLPQVDGAFVVVVQDRVVKLTADGARDLAFGIEGVGMLAPPVGAISMVTAVAARTGGGWWLAGTTQLDPLNFSDLEDFVAEIGADGAQVAYVVVDPVGGVYLATDVDADGVVLRLGPDDVRLGAATLPRPEGATDARFHDGGVVIARSGTRVTSMTRAGIVGDTIDLPLALGEELLLASPPDGPLYVAGSSVHPPEPTSVVDDGIYGYDLGLVRIVDGEIDTSFGDDGVAHASFMNARTPIVLETIWDRVGSLVIGPDGAPWLSGWSQAIETAERDWLRNVENYPVVVRFLP